MEIRNNAEALKAFLGVSSSNSAQTPLGRSGENLAAQAALAGDKATLSQAGVQVLQSAEPAGVRAGRVTAIQKAMAAGTYNVPASTVADKVMDVMLEGGIARRA